MFNLNQYFVCCKVLLSLNLCFKPILYSTLSCSTSSYLHQKIYYQFFTLWGIEWGGKTFNFLFLMFCMQNHVIHYIEQPHLCGRIRSYHGLLEFSLPSDTQAPKIFYNLLTSSNYYGLSGYGVILIHTYTKSYYSGLAMHSDLPFYHEGYQISIFVHFNWFWRDIPYLSFFLFSLRVPLLIQLHLQHCSLVMHFLGGPF